MVEDLMRYAVNGWGWRDWYSVARREIEDASRVLGVAPSTLAGLLAAYSPRVPVRRSIEYAIFRVFEPTRHHRGVMLSVRSSVEYFESHGHLRGPKTEAFRRGISGDDSVIVLDVWMSYALQVPASHLTKRYEELSDVVREASRRLCITPTQTQAAVWAGIIRASGGSPAMLSFSNLLPTLWSR